VNKIFSGANSVPIWASINNAKTKRDLRDALYNVCLQLQRLESKIDGSGDLPVWFWDAVDFIFGSSPRYEFLAMDKCGCWYLYSSRPVIRNDAWVGSAVFSHIPISLFGDWNESLTARPNTVIGRN
jgi:hypothetical protein